MAKIIFCALIIILLKLCASDGSECGKVYVKKSTPLIVNGELAYHGQFPWLAPLFLSGKYICGSSIISEWHLLTAAHCVDDKVANKYHTLVGRFDLTNSNEFYWKQKNISIIYAHEDFNISAEVQRSDGDIAILRVKEKIKYTPYIQPVCLPDESTNTANKNGLTAGYGKLEIYGNHQNTPSYVALKSIDKWKCGKKGIVYANIVSEKSFCAGDSTNLTSIPCRGDSGGAFLVHDRVMDQYTILGIVSFSIGLCNPKDYVAFSDVTQYIDWINDTIEFDKHLYGESSDPCESIDCSDKGECQVINGKKECVCLPQYSGTYPQCGLSCSTNDDCADDRKCLLNVCIDLCLEMTLSCVNNAECKMKNHQPKCECMDGYDGNGYSKCEINQNFIDGRLRYDDNCEPNCTKILAFDVDDDDTRAVVAGDIRILPKHRNESVELLNISGYKYFLNSLPVNVGEVFPDLKNYQVKNQILNKIKRENFVNLNKLEKLKISENIFKKLIEINALNDLTELRVLQLNENRISNLPENLFDKNPKLVILDLNTNQLSLLNFKHFQNLIELKSLNLSINELVTLPENIFINNLKLEEIHLYSNKISTLNSKVFQNLKDLKILELSLNYLTSLPDNIFVRNLKLEEIDLSSNKISTLHSKVFDNLLELKNIWLHENELTSLPEDIFDDNLKLEEVYLYLNKISALNSNFIQNLKDLKMLFLWGNQLTSLPKNIFNENSKLEVINLSRNKISSLNPAVFDNKPNLRFVDLESNTCINKEYGNYYKHMILSDEERKSLRNDLKQNC